MFFLNLSRRKIVLIFLILLVSTSIIEIWSLNRLSTYGEKISNLEESKNELTLQNQLLNDQIDKRTSFLEMEKYAKIYGFSPIKIVQYIGK